jgi:hypothetical protein
VVSAVFVARGNCSYLRGGLLAGIITHYVYDLVWFAAPIFLTPPSAFLLDKVAVLFFGLLPALAVLHYRYQHCRTSGAADRVGPIVITTLGGGSGGSANTATHCPLPVDGGGVANGTGNGSTATTTAAADHVLLAAATNAAWFVARDVANAAEAAAAVEAKAREPATRVAVVQRRGAPGALLRMIAVVSPVLLVAWLGYAQLRSEGAFCVPVSRGVAVAGAVAVLSDGKRVNQPMHIREWTVSSAVTGGQVPCISSLI